MAEQQKVDSVDSEEALRALYPGQSEIVQKKLLPALDEHCRHFIELSPFLCISTANADGAADISPRGDAPGFVQVLDDKHILIPDRRGNNRLDTMSNITHNAHVGLIFFIPGIRECLRANGRAQIVRDNDIMARFAVRERVPLSAILVEIDECFLHCAKAIMRAKLWDEKSKVERSVLPSLARMIKDQTRIAASLEETEAQIEDSYTNRLY